MVRAHSRRFFANRPRRYWPLAVSALALAAVLVVARLSHGPYLLYNRSPSVPVGLYWLHHDTERHALERGDLAVLRVPAGVQGLVDRRRWLGAGAYLLKPVAAVAGDRVCTRNREVTVNGTAFGKVRATDQAGRALPRHRHCGAVPDGAVYVLSRNSRSFDSRHYGPVPTAHVIARASPLWTS